MLKFPIYLFWSNKIIFRFISSKIFRYLSKIFPYINRSTKWSLL